MTRISEQFIFCAAVAFVCVGSPVRAEAPAPSEAAVPPLAMTPASPAAKEDASPFIDPADGQLDVSRFLATPRRFLPVPMVVTEPAVGYGGGMIAAFFRPRADAGEEGWARPDISAIGAIATQNGTRAAFAGDVSRWLDGRVKTLVGAGAGQVNLDFYGLDPRSADNAVRYTLKFAGGVAQANWQVAPKSPWAIGLRYVYADVEPQLRDAPVAPGLADRIQVKVSGPTAILEFDTRDNIFTPTRGAYSESSWFASRKGLGASEDFDQFQQVLMGWLPADDKVTLGARFNYAWTSSDTPFFLRPFVMLRGVPAMSVQGDQMASLEAEARWQFYGRWSLIGFGGAGATRTSLAATSTAKNVTSGGVGFRYELARKFGLHVGADLAYSGDDPAIYLQVGSAWLRP
ncbi:hypothetical protein OPU71_05515 [Niveibacterium sp. 24ML]|uniref:hypothetical protein n=1 Tax=Niveibacterium sp. 24ML TaxID=2985512 RepID=UPI00226F5379|nr:hypothetical protein [Niveibacterium sp. 24ML]MCX9155579.1 hypothetical protein [Niveibacterium sp. 24ML]